jgi:hypothetical protein
MNNLTYTFQTPDHSFDFIPDLFDPNKVKVTSEYKDSLEDFLNVIELAGRANDEDFQEITIKEEQNSYDSYYFIEISKDDLALYLQFEVRFFMGASLNG